MLNLAPIVAVELALNDEFVHLLQVAGLFYYYMAKVASGNFTCVDGDALVATDEHVVVGVPCIDKTVGVETLAGNNYSDVVVCSVTVFIVTVII